MQQGSEGSGGWMELWRWMLVGRWSAAKQRKMGNISGNSEPIFLKPGWLERGERGLSGGV